MPADGAGRPAVSDNDIRQWWWQDAVCLPVKDIGRYCVAY